MIQSPLESGRKNKEFEESDLIDLHHNFMVVYGWIPLEEFKNLPVPTMFNLAEKVSKEIARRENMRLSTLSFYGVKNPK